MAPRLELLGIGLPEVRPGDDLAGLLAEAFAFEDQDVLVVASKVVAKAEGRLVPLAEVKPSARARRLARKTGKDPVMAELILREGQPVGVVPVFALVEAGALDPAMLAEDAERALELLRKDPTLILTLRQNDFYTDAGIDRSNAPEGHAVLPLQDPDQSAERIRSGLRARTGREVAVLISDTEVFAEGSVELCRGVAGICPTRRRFGAPDRTGRPKWGGAEAQAFALCMAASLLMGQADEGVPAVVVRGLRYQDCRRRPTDLAKAAHVLLRANLRFWGLGRVLLGLLRGRFPRG